MANYDGFHRQLLSEHREWIAEHRFAHARRFRFDFANPSWLLAIEIQGGIWTGGRHSRGGKAQLAEMQKMNLAAIFRWHVMYFSPQQINSGIAIAQVRYFKAGLTV